jgi:hypothetical protein
LFGVAGMMGSIVSMISTTARVFSSVSSAYNFVNSVVATVQICQELMDGMLFNEIIRQIQNIIQSQVGRRAAPETSKLSDPEFWSDASVVLLQSIPKLMFTMFHRMGTLIQLMNRGKTNWVIYMPTPYESWIPNLTSTIPLPGLKIANRSVELFFGGGGSNERKNQLGGNHRGRLFGLGTITRHNNARGIVRSQLFRMDYHTSNHVPNDEYFEISGNVYKFHFHLEKQNQN